MTAHVSKEQLGLIMPGNTSQYFQGEPQYLGAPNFMAPRPGLIARFGAWLSGWARKQMEMEEVAGLSDAQLADIGISRSEAPLVFDAAFAARRNSDRMVAALQTGRIAGI